MATGKLSPRQKMINMMYLVLMALLALNVSNEVLKAFHLLEISFHQNKKNLQSSIGERLQALQDESKNQKNLVPYYERALKAHSITDEFVEYVDSVISDLEELSGGRVEPDEESNLSSTEKTELVQADNIERHANYFLVDNSAGTKGWRAKQLEEEINSTRRKLVELLHPDEPAISVERGIMEKLEKASTLRAELTPQEAGNFNSWTEKYLAASPLAAVVTLLTKIQSDARSLESAVIEELSRGKAPIHKVDRLIPIVKPKSSAILLGEEYEAEVFLAALTSGYENNVYELEDGQPLTVVNGAGIIEQKATTSGTQQFKGVIKVETRDGLKEYPFASEYQVFNGQAAISADAMNILYIGVDNPITIAVPGINPKDVSVSISNGTLTRRNGNNYIAKVSQTGKSEITAHARMNDGTTRLMGRSVYRVRNLPKPEATWGALSNTKLAVPRQVLMSHRNILANMGEEFAFEGSQVDHQIARYKFIYVPKRNGTTQILNKTGGRIDDQIINILRGSKAGDQVFVTDIVARGPDGFKRLNTISFTLN